MLITFLDVLAWSNVICQKFVSYEIGILAFVLKRGWSEIIAIVFSQKENSKQALHKVPEKSNLEIPCFFLPDLKEVPPSFRCSSCGGGHHIYSLIQFRFGICNGIWPKTRLFIFLWSFLELTTKQPRTAVCEVNPLTQHGGIWLPPHI